MRKLAIALLALFALRSNVSYADDRPLLVVAEMIEINAGPVEVWNLVKRFDGLVNWHPAFSGSPLVKGKDGQVGAVRALTLKDGPTFTEELIAFNEQGMTYTYDIVESPLPIDVFDRYHIVSPGDLQDIARRLAGIASGIRANRAVDWRRVSL